MPNRPKRPAAVRASVRVHLSRADRTLLDQVAQATGLSRAEVLRRGLRRMGASVLAETNPVLALLDEMASGDWPVALPREVAERHDQYLAEAHSDRHEPVGG